MTLDMLKLNEEGLIKKVSGLELLKRRLDIFLLPYEKIENTFSKYNIKTLVSIINEDIANIDVF